MRKYTEAYKMHCAAVALWSGGEADDDTDLIGYINNFCGSESGACGYDSDGRYIESSKLYKSGELTNNELRLKIDKLEKSRIHAFAVDNKYLCILCTSIERFIKSEFRDESDIFIIDFSTINDYHIDNSWFSKVNFKFALISGDDEFCGNTGLPFNDTICTQKGLDLIDYTDVSVECIDNEYVNISNCSNISIRCSISDNGWFTVTDSEYCSIFIDELGDNLEACMIEHVNDSLLFVDNIKNEFRLRSCDGVSIVTRKRYYDKIKLDNCENCKIIVIDADSDNDNIVNSLSKYAETYIKLGKDPFEVKTILSYALTELNYKSLDDLLGAFDLEWDDLELEDGEQLKIILDNLRNGKPTEKIKKKLTKFKMLNPGDVRLIGGKYIALIAENSIGIDKADIILYSKKYVHIDKVINNALLYDVYHNKDISINGSLLANRVNIDAQLNIFNASFISMLNSRSKYLNICTIEKCDLSFSNCKIGCINIVNSSDICFAHFDQHFGNFNIVNSKFEFLELDTVVNSVINIKNCYGELEISHCEGYILIINGKEVNLNTIPPYRVDEDGIKIYRIKLCGSRWM